MTQRRRSHWAWGWADAEPDATERAAIAAKVAPALGMSDLTWRDPVPFEDIELPVSRLSAPDALAEILTNSPYERARRTHGKAYQDVVNGFYGRFTTAPDLVATPADESDVVRVLDWCAEVGAAVVPYGGGTSVVGGIDGGGEWADQYSGVVTLDLTRMDQMLEIDRTSRAARVQAGVFGPALEQQLRPHGYTLRHFMQSFEFSTLGGWLATRAGGHYATNYTHIDDLTESIRLVTPQGVGESRRLPGSGAGPSPDRLVLGSEGTLGVITEAWMRLQDRPGYRTSAAVRFRDYASAVDAVRAISQAALFPANCRLLDATETAGNIGGGRAAADSILILGFESADRPTSPGMTRALEICQERGGQVPDGVVTSEPGSADPGTSHGAVAAWRQAFIRAPYLSSTMVRLGVLSETFETACTWDRFHDLHAAVTKAVGEIFGKRTAGAGTLSCRFTHVYPDGPAPYFSVRAPVGHGNELAAHRDLKDAISDAFAENGGTITHHHAVGRHHRPWYDRQMPGWFLESLRHMKRANDPTGMLNPGVLLDPLHSADAG